jgi:tellurite resistance protein TerC
LFFAATVPLGFSYTKPAFLVFTSSAFAMLGFRSLYYAVAGLTIDMARLKAALGAVFVIMAINLFVHPFLGTREPTWLLPVLGLLAVMVPVASAVRGIEEELVEEREEREERDRSHRGDA